ncbi:MAG TPA: hypothetical protein VK175_00325 [Leadbetterella sp.]|nr:hypothetical protein [Leadbetterella sp.]
METKYLDFFVKLPQNPTYKDPFDRLIISTVEGLKIISKDKNLISIKISSKLFGNFVTIEKSFFSI